MNMEKRFTEKLLRGSLKSTALISLVAIALLLMTYGVFSQMRRLEEDRLQTVFLAKSENITSGLHENLLFHHETVHSVARLFELNPDITSRQFQDFNTHNTRVFDGVRAIEWSPRVSKEQREDFEKEASLEDFDDYRIKKWTSNNSWVREETDWSTHYWPVRFVHPLKGNEAAVGIDLASHPVRREALERTVRSQTFAVSGRVHLAQDEVNRSGILVFAPAFKIEDDQTENVTPIGCALGVFNLNSIVESVFKSRDTKGLQLQISDNTDPSNPTLLYESPKFAESNSTWAIDFPVRYGGRDWTLRWTTEPNFISSQRSWTPWLVLVAGLLATIGLCSNLVQSNRRAAAVNRLVAQRTKQLELAITGGSVGLWDWNLQTNTAYFSAESHLHLGVPQGKLSSYRSWEDRIHPDDLPDFEQAVSGYLDGDRDDFEIEFRVRHSDGKFRWLLSRGLVDRDASGNATHFRGTIVDITDQKNAEQKATHYALELKRANIELEQFAHVASHDLKEPLRGIDHLASWIAEDVGDQLPPESHDHLRKLRDRVKRMEQLINDLLEYSKIGKHSAGNEIVDLRAVLDNIVQTLTIPAQYKIEFHGDVAPGKTSRAPLEQVLRNLIGNAIKHRKSDAGRVDVRLREQKDMVEIEIEDDGPGIPERFRRKIFEIFQTLQPRDTLEGSGMGLTIVKKLVDFHGGEISIEPEDSAAKTTGALFKLKWPYQVVRETIEA